MSFNLIAFGLLVAYGSITFGLRSYLLFRRTGSTGFRGIGGKPGSVEWWAGVLLIASFVGLAAVPILALSGVAAGLSGLSNRAVGIVGIGVFAAGFIATFAAQIAMGTSWRIGVRAGEVTDLVVGGPFAIVRNPIFSAMLVASAGLVLMVPSVVALSSFALTVVALELQVRGVEEPYLLRTHGARYEAYASRVGRFLPGVGRLRTKRGS